MTSATMDENVWVQAGREKDFELPMPGGGTMPFRRIPGGSFRMGSRTQPNESPIHRVIVPEFRLGKFVVTQAEYEQIVPHAPARTESSAGQARLDPDPSYFKGPRRPVEQVRWDDAQWWLAGWNDWLEKQGHPWRVRLPNEAEWEYACRSGTETEYHNGDNEEALGEIAWFDENSGEETHNVDERVAGAIESHPAGLVGMHGNVFEWCADVWDASASAKRGNGWVARPWTLDDAGSDAMHQYASLKPGEDPDRVLRGGSWYISAGGCRAAFRDWRRADDRYWNCGFRVALVPKSGGPSLPARLDSQRAEGRQAEACGGGGTTPEQAEAGSPGAVDLAGVRGPKVLSD